MPRPVTLFTGQWADLPLTELAPQVKSMGYDGVEFAGYHGHTPEAIRAKWSTRVEVISPAEWSRRDAREGGVFYTFAPVRAWGRFVRVQVTVSERLARPESQAPAQYASSITYYLMELNGEWLLLAAEGWST